jgi:hypothetical protein
LPDEARTFNVYGTSTEGDWTKYHPWRAPGYAPVESSCGMAGAYWDYGDDNGGGVPVGSYAARTRGEDITPTAPATQWTAGSTVEVGWQMRANHGGGYQYRLCPADGGPPNGQTDEWCFQQTPLPFAEETTTIRYLDGSRSDFQIPAITVSQGTWPEGSQWRRNPIPNCLFGPQNPDRGFHPQEAGLPQDTQYTAHVNCPEGCSFEPAWEEGCGENSWTLDQMPFAIVDRVVLPSTPGTYLLSWRWDSEQTGQIWANCADVILSSGEGNMTVTVV